MTFTFEDAKNVCSRLRDRGEEDTRKLAELLATCVHIGQWTDGLENTMDSQVNEEAFSAEMVDYALSDLALTISRSLKKLEHLAEYLPDSDDDATIYINSLKKQGVMK